jgi:LysM repeat protein
MKRIALLALGLVLVGPPALPAQDAATEERLNKLSGQIEDLRSSNDALTRRIDGLSKEIDSLRSQMDKPTGNFASDEDLRRLADTVKEIDRKRLDDYEKIRAELKSLGKTLAASTPSVRKTSPPAAVDPPSEKSSGPDKGFEYQVKRGDTLLLIVQAYRDNNIKVTMDQVLKANPGLKPKEMRIGQKIFIPAPQS